MFKLKLLHAVGLKTKNLKVQLLETIHPEFAPKGAIGKLYLKKILKPIAFN